MQFEITNRRIKQITDGYLVGDNSDYIAYFNFDSEWNNVTKTARFEMDGEYIDVILVNDQCNVPVEVLSKGYLTVGVYSSQMSTTPCEVYISPSIKESGSKTITPTPDVYSQILDKIDNLTVSDEDVRQAVSDILDTDNIHIEETDPTVPDFVKNITQADINNWNSHSGSGGSVDLSNYYTKSQVDAKIPTNVSAFNNDSGYLTQHQSLTNYATKSYVDTAVANVNTSGSVDLSNYYNKTETDELLSNERDSIDEEYASKSYVDGKLKDIDISSSTISSGIEEDVTSTVFAGLTKVDNASGNKGIVNPYSTFDGGTRIYAKVLIGNVDFTDEWLATNPVMLCTKKEDNKLRLENYYNLEPNRTYTFISNTKDGRFADVIVKGFDRPVYEFPQYLTPSWKTIKFEEDGWSDQAGGGYTIYELRTVGGVSVGNEPWDDGRVVEETGAVYDVSNVTGSFTFGADTIGGNELFVFVDKSLKFHRKNTSVTNVTYKLDVTDVSQVVVVARCYSSDDTPQNSVYAKNDIWKDTSGENILINVVAKKSDGTVNDPLDTLAICNNLAGNEYIRWSTSPIYSGGEVPLSTYIQNNIYTKSEVDALIPTVPTKTSDLTNDAGFITSASLPTKTSDLTNDSGFITNSSLSNYYTKTEADNTFAVPADIPTKTSDLTNDSGFITSASLPTKVSDLTNDSGFITSSSIPTNVSAFTNDAGYLTQHQSLANYYTKTETDAAINTAIGGAINAQY